MPTGVGYTTKMGPLIVTLATNGALNIALTQLTVPRIVLLRVYLATSTVPLMVLNRFKMEYVLTF